MSRKELEGAGNLSFGIKGFIDIVLENKDRTIRKRYYNAINPAFKEAILAKGVGPYFMGHGFTAGNKFVIDNAVASGSNSDDECSIAPNGLTNILINNDGIVGVPGNVSKAFNTDFSLNNDVIVGEAYNSDVASGYTGKRIVNQNAASKVAQDIICNQWQYPEGVATGTITHIGMSMGSIESMYSGLRVVRNLDNFKYVQGGSFTPSYKFTPPGITGVTGDSEVYFNGGDGTSNTHKLNLSTGVVEDSPAGYREMPDTYLMDYIVIDGYLYCMYDSSSYVYVYSLPDMSQVRSIDALGGSYSRCSFYYDYTNEVLYVSGNYSSSYDGQNLLAKLSKNGNAYFSSVETRYTDYSSLNLPFTIDEEKYFIKSMGPNQILLQGRDVDNYNFKGLLVGKALVDGKVDVRNTIYPITPRQTVISWIDNLNTFYVFDLAYSFGLTDTQVFNKYLKYTYYFSNSNQSSQQLYTHPGVLYSTENDCCQLCSLSALATPIEKGANDTLYVTYGYQVV